MRSRLLVAAILLGSAAPVAGQQPLAGGRYVSAVSGKASDIQAAVDRFSADGFRIVALSPDGGSILLLLERRDPGEPSITYRVVSSDAGRLEQRMNEAARQGFRVAPGVPVLAVKFKTETTLWLSDVADSGWRLLLMQRSAASRPPGEYRVPRRAPSVGTLRELTAQGFVPIETAVGRVIFERTSESPAARDPDAFALINGGKSVATDPWKQLELQRELDAAVGRGYRLVMLDANADGRVLLILRRSQSREPKIAFRLLCARGVAGVQSAANRAAADGFRLSARSLIMRGELAFAFMERTSADDVPRYAISGPITEETAGALAGDAVPVALVQQVERSYVVTEGRAPVARSQVRPELRESPVPSFAALRGVAALGDRLLVTKREGRVTGTLVYLDSELLTLQNAAGLYRIAATDVSSIDRIDASDRAILRGSVIGAGLGALVGLLALQSCDFNGGLTFACLGPLVDGALGGAAGAVLWWAKSRPAAHVPIYSTAGAYGTLRIELVASMPTASGSAVTAATPALLVSMSPFDRRMFAVGKTTR